MYANISRKAHLQFTNGKTADIASTINEEVILEAEKRAITQAIVPAEIEVTILMPCLNEAETLATCIRKAHLGCQKIGLVYEILVSDNGSTDGSKAIAIAEKARVIDVPVKGYGAALLTGIKAAQGKYIIMGDSDDSYDFTQVAPFIEKLRVGYELVMGSRLKGEIKPGAMPFLHRWLGNPVLTKIGQVFFENNLSDYHCGLRGFDKEALLKIHLQTTGMEFASEMVIKACLAGLKIAETPVTLWPDGRSHPPHLRTWQDGWRHLRFMLLYSPRWLFLVPGLLLFFSGFAITLALVGGPINIAGYQFDLHYMTFGILQILVGFQIIALGIHAKVYSVTHKFISQDAIVSFLGKYFNLEKGILLGSAIFTIGLIANGYIFFLWLTGDFDSTELLPLRQALLAMTLMVIGTQTVFSSFFLSILRIEKG